MGTVRLFAWALSNICKDTSPLGLATTVIDLCEKLLFIPDDKVLGDTLFCLQNLTNNEDVVKMVFESSNLVGPKIFSFL
jgi:hypothetical protein